MDSEVIIITDSGMSVKDSTQPNPIFNYITQASRDGATIGETAISDYSLLPVLVRTEALLVILPNVTKPGFLYSVNPITSEVTARVLNASIDGSFISILEIVNGLRVATVYDGANKSTYTNGALTSTTFGLFPGNHVLTTYTIALFNRVLSPQEAMQVTLTSGLIAAVARIFNDFFDDFFS